MDQILGSVAANQTYALLNPLDLYETEVAKDLGRRVPTPQSLNWLKKMEGRMATRKTTRSSYKYYEEGQYMSASATIAAIAADGARFDITLSAADHGNVGGTGKSSFPVVGQQVLFGDSRTTGYVYSKSTSVDSAHVVKVSKTDSSQDIAAVATVGSQMVFFSNGQTEGSGGTTSRVEQYSTNTNYLQIIREKFEVTDEEMYNIAWFEPVPGKRYLWYKGIEATANRFELQTQLALLISNQSSGLAAANGSVVQTTHGLIPQIRTGGAELDYFGKPDMAAFDEVILHLDNNYGENRYFVGEGIDLMLGLKDFLVEFGKNTLSFSPFSGGESQAIKLDFKGYAIGEWEFYFNLWKILSHKDTIGANGMNFRTMGIFIPAGVTKDADPNLAPGSDTHKPYMTMVTPPLSNFAANSNIVKDDYLMWEEGAFANQGATSDLAKKTVHFLRYVGLELRNRNKFLLWNQA